MADYLYLQAVSELDERELFFPSFFFFLPAGPWLWLSADQSALNVQACSVV